MPNPSLIVVLITVMINMMGVGLAWPILPALVQELTGGSVSEVAVMYGAIAIVFSLMQFVVAPVMGILSDRYGRRPVMLVALTALGFDNILMALAPTITWMFFGRMIGGAFASSMAIANAYVADTTTEKDRAKGFGMIGAAFGIGFVLGPALGGFLGEIDLRLPFWFAAFLSLGNAFFGWIFLKESHPPQNRTVRSLRQSSPLASIKWIFATPSLVVIASVVLMSNTMQRGMESVWVLFTRHQYGWGMPEAGISLAVVGISYIVVQGYLAGKVIPWLGESKTIFAGLIISAFMFLLMAFNTSGMLGYIGIIPYVLGSALAGTAVHTLASKRVEATRQGYLQGAIGGLNGLAAITGPLLATSSFAWFTSEGNPINFPGAYFMLGTFVFLIAAILVKRAKL